MKIYLVTIEDQDTIDVIDNASSKGKTIYIGDSIRMGTISEIEEYVNVDSP